MECIYFVKNGKIVNEVHAFVEKEYITRKMLAEGQKLSKPDEYIIVFDLLKHEIVGVLGIMDQMDGKLPFQDSFSGVTCGKKSIEFARFVIKRMISIDDKIEIGKKLFEAAVNWYILQSKTRCVDIDCYLETQDYIIDFFNKITKKKNIFFPIKEAVFKNNSSLSENSMGFIKNSLVYKINTINAICPKLERNSKVA